MQIVAWPRRSIRKPCPQTLSANPVHNRLRQYPRSLVFARSCWAKMLAEPSALRPETVEGSYLRSAPSMLMLHFADGSILQDRTLHAEARNCGRFILQSGTLHAEARNRGRFHSPDPNPPRFRPESRTVRCKQNQPSTRRLDITDGPCLRSAPSMLMPHIADGSILQARTFHENAPHHGRFSIQSGTLRAEVRNRGRFHSPDQFPRPIPQARPPGPNPSAV